MRIRNWLELAISIEKRSAELYGKFADIFRDHRDVAEMWKRMQSDEIRHKAILEGVKEDLRDVDRMKLIHQRRTEKTEKLLSCISDDLPKIFHDLDEAYECAHELEQKEVDIIFDLLKDDIINKHKGVYELLKEDQGHLQRLIDFGDRFDSPALRKAIKSKQGSSDSHERGPIISR